MSFPELNLHGNLQESEFPMWEVTVKNPDKLLPTRYRKVLNQSINNKTKPQNKEQVKTKIRQRIDINELDRPILGLYHTKVANDMFETAWKEVSNLKGPFLKKQKVDIHDFKHLMTDSLAGLEPLQEAFETWFNDKFADKRTSKKYVKQLDKKASYLWLNTDDINQVIIDITDELDDAMSNIIEQAGTDEREVSRADLQTIKELNITLKHSQIKRIAASVKSSQYKDYESWKAYVMPNIFKRSTRFLNKRQDKALHKFYNRVISSVKTNGNIREVDGQPIAA